MRSVIVKLAKMLTDCMDAKMGLVRMDESRWEYKMLDALLPSYRTSRKEVEGGLLSSFTREQFEMQEVSELTVFTLLVRYKTG